MESMERQSQVGQSPSPMLPPSTGGREWLASRLLHRQVVNAYTLEPVGRIEDVVFDPAQCQIAALKVHSDESAGSGMPATRRFFGRQRTSIYISLDHIVALNGDVVTVDVNPAHPAASERVRRLQHLSEVRDYVIITLHGMALGSFVDLLMNPIGSVIAGYVITPTKQASALFASLEELNLPMPRNTEATDTAGATGETGESHASRASSETDAPPIPPSAAGLRIIPATPRVRFGDALILVMEDVEPLRQETVIITSQPEPSADHAASLAHMNGRHTEDGA